MPKEDDDDGQVDAQGKHPLGLLLGLGLGVGGLVPLRGMLHDRGYGIGGLLASRLVLGMVRAYLVVGAHFPGVCSGGSSEGICMLAIQDRP